MNTVNGNPGLICYGKDFKSISMFETDPCFAFPRCPDNFSSTIHGRHHACITLLQDGPPGNASMTASCLCFGDMQSTAPQNFVENFSEFSAAQRNAGKHVTIMSELSRLVDARTLMQVRLNLPAPRHKKNENISSDFYASYSNM